MSNGIVVRRALEQDAARLLALRTSLFRETEYLLWEPDEFRDTVDDERQRISRLNGRSNSLCLVAEELALYKRCGFEVEGTRRRSLLVGDRYVDEYLMSFISAA